MDLAPKPPAPPKCHWRQWLALFAASSAVCSVQLEGLWFSLARNESQEEFQGFDRVCFTSIGAIIGAVMADIYGRKKALEYASAMVIPRIIAVLSVSETWRWLSMCLSAVGYGITATVVPLYISEISSTYNRGKFMVIPQTFTYCGIIVTLLLAVICYALDNPILYCVFIAAFMAFHFVTLFVFPETPYYLNWKKGSYETIKSLTFFKGIEFVRNPDPVNLLVNLQEDTSLREWFNSMREIFESATLINITTILFLVTFRAATVLNAVQFFTLYYVARKVEITKSADPSILNKLFRNIIIAFIVGFISSIFITFNTRLIRRKSSLLVTIFVGLVALIISAAFIGNNEWMFVLNLLVYGICDCMFGGVINIYAGEFFPINIRAIAMAAIISWGEVMRYLSLQIRLKIFGIDLAVGNFMDVSQYVTLDSILTCILFLAGFIWVLAFFPSVNYVPKLQIVINTTADDDTLELIDSSEAPESPTVDSVIT